MSHFNGICQKSMIEKKYYLLLTYSVSKRQVLN